MVTFPLDDVNIDEDGRLTRNSTKVLISMPAFALLCSNFLSHSDITKNPINISNFRLEIFALHTGA